MLRGYHATISEATGVTNVNDLEEIEDVAVVEENVAVVLAAVVAVVGVHGFGRRPDAGSGPGGGGGERLGVEQVDWRRRGVGVPNFIGGD